MTDKKSKNPFKNLFSKFKKSKKSDSDYNEADEPELERDDALDPNEDDGDKTDQAFRLSVDDLEQFKNEAQAAVPSKNIETENIDHDEEDQLEDQLEDEPPAVEESLQENVETNTHIQIKPPRVDDKTLHNVVIENEGESEFELAGDDEDDDSEDEIEALLSQSSREVVDNVESNSDDSLEFNDQSDEDEEEEITDQIQELNFSKDDKEALDDDFEDFVETIDEVTPPTEFTISDIQKDALDEFDEETKAKAEELFPEESNQSLGEDGPDSQEPVYQEDDSDALEAGEIEKSLHEKTITKKIKREGLLDKIESYELNEEPETSEHNFSLKEIKVPKKLNPAEKAKDFLLAIKKNPKETLKNIPVAFASLLKSTTAKASNIAKEIKNNNESSELTKNFVSSKLVKKISTVDYKDLVANLFSPEARPAVHKTFIATLVIIGSYQSSKIISGFLGPSYKPTKANFTDTTKAAPRINFNQIARKDLFNTNPKSESTINEPIKKTINKNIVCKEADKKSTLPLKLVNSIVLQDSIKSIASVQVRSSSDLVSIREGDKIKNLAEVGKIGAYELIVKNLDSGECEVVQSSKKKPNTKSKIKVISKKKAAKIKENLRDERISNDGDNYTIKKSVVEEILAGGLAEVIQQAKAIPMKQPDGTIYFKMTEVIPGSLYTKLGIQEGDIITSINGQTFKNILEVQSMYVKLKEFENFKLGIKRENEEINKGYSFD